MLGRRKKKESSLASVQSCIISQLQVEGHMMSYEFFLAENLSKFPSRKRTLTKRMWLCMLLLVNPGTLQVISMPGFLGGAE